MAAEEKLAMPTEEDAAPRIGNDGQALTDHQKGEILQAIDEKKREEKKAANAIVRKALVFMVYRSCATPCGRTGRSCFGALFLAPTG